MPEISVIASARNMESRFSFIASVESILAQRGCDIEFLFCDDGSTDGTAEVLRRYAIGDRRVRVLYNSHNLGLAASLNRLAAEAKSPYLARHDFDDISKRDRLKRQLEYMNAHPTVAILGTQVRRFNEKGVTDNLRYPLRVERRDFLFGCPYMHGSVVMRRSAFFAAGGYLVSKETRRTEDYELFMRLAEQGEGANLPKFLYHYCEDREALARREYRYRLDEARIRYRGFCRLGLMPEGLLYVLKPLAVGLLPPSVTRYLRRVRDRRLAREDRGEYL